MNNLIPVAVYEKGNIKNNGDLESLNSEAKKSPVIYVDSDAYIEIYGTIMTINNEKYDISKLKILDIVRTLTENGINANLANSRYAMCPAILMSDFKSINTKINKIEQSPMNLIEYGLSHMEAVYSILDSVTFNVIEINSTEKEHSFDLIDSTVYTDVSYDSVIMYEEKYVKYLLNIQEYKIINGYNFENNSIIGSYVTSGV